MLSDGFTFGSRAVKGFERSHPSTEGQLEAPSAMRAKVFANHSWRQGLLVCTALFTVGMIATDAVAQSAGGRGGDGNHDSQGGAGQTFGVVGAAGGDSIYYRGGGGGGGAGAAGGKGGSNTGSGGTAGTDGNAGSPIGVNGGDGGSANYGGGGGGGGGGNGIRFSAGGMQTTISATGGNGGTGGTTFYNNSGAGGGGGSGGYGVGATGGALNLNVFGTVTGGNGGAGGTGYGDRNSGGSSGGGGDGGGGIYFGSAGSTLNLAAGSVIGGNGGAGGIGGRGNGASGRGGNGVDFGGTVNNTVSTAAGTTIKGGNGASGAAGGVGIVGSGITILNDGTIAGGYSNLGSTGAVQADAISFTGGANSLRLGNTGTIDGNIGVTGRLAIDPGTMAAGSVTLGNIIHDNTTAGSLLKSGEGRLVLTGMNTYTGGTTFAAGTLNAGSAGAFGTSGALSFTGGTLQYSAANQVDYSSRFSTAAGQKYSVDTNGHNITWAADLTSSGASLAKSGTGTLTLTGATGYTGDSVVAGGTLQFGDGARGGTGLGGSITVASGAAVSFETPGSFDIGGRVELGDTAAMSIRAGAGQPLLKTQGLKIGADVNFNLSGVGDPNRASQVLIDSNSVIQGDFATISVGGFSGTVDYMTVNTRKSADGKQYLASYDLSWTANNNLAHGTFTLADAANSFTIGTELTDRVANPATGWDGKSLTKAGAGKLILAGDTTYSGGTTIAGGTLQIGEGGIAGSIVGDVVNAGTLAFDRSGTVTVAGTISGSGKLRQQGVGTVVLSGINSYRGGTVLDAGKLSVSADANLGDLSGGLAFHGGTLNTTDSFDTGRAVTLDSSGRFDVAANTLLGLSGAVSGSGDLIKAGAGTLKLSNDGNVYGNTFVEAGLLIGNASTISGRIGNAATMVFDQAPDGTFAGDIGALNGNRGIMIKRGAGELMLTGTSALDWSVEKGKLSTTASRFGGNVMISAGAGVTFDEQADALYSGAISGTGNLTKTGSGTLKLAGDSSGFVGSTSIAKGILSVDGSLGGSIRVMPGARLQGKGTISELTVAAGSTIAPGNSIGTLNVAGDVTLAAGSIYEVEIAGNGASDRIAAKGKATLGGAKVEVTALDAATSYQDGRNYTILTADGGIAGAFDPAVLSRSAFLDATLAQGKNTVDLKIAVKGARPHGPVFEKAANTFNRQQTAGALDKLQQSGQSLALYNKLLPLSTEEARLAFDGLSGEVNASTVTGLLEDSHFLRDAVNDRLRAAFEAVGAKQASSAERYGAWGSAFGLWGSIDSDGNAASLDRSTGGFIIGVDGLAAGDWRLGMLAGYSQSSFKVDDRKSATSSDNYHLGIYGGTQWDALTLRSGFAYTWSEIETRRQSVFPGFSDSMSGSYRAGTSQLFGELGYSMKAGRVAFEPFANVAYVNVDTHGFAEKGGAAALTVHGASNDVALTTLGVRASAGFDIGSTSATARGMVGWRHGYGDVTPMISQTLMGSGAFSIAGVPVARDAALLEAGVDFSIAPAAALGFSYQGQMASGSQEHGFRADLTVRF
jgi:outer membrane autotransporter protein